MKKFVFVLMPFKPDFDDVYKLGIKSACETDTAYCERVDEQKFEGSMLDRIYSQIRRADCIIADMSTQNPNVFYEVGYAHALGKKVILITQDGSDIPFDMKHYQHIIYNRGNISHLHDEIRSRIHWYLASEHDASNDSDFELDVFLNDTLLTKNENQIVNINLERTEDSRHVKYYGRIRILLRNVHSSLYNAANTMVSIVLPSTIESGERSITLPDGQVLHYTSFEGEKVYPQGYWGQTISVTIEGPPVYCQSVLSLNLTGEIRISKPYSMMIYPFSMHFTITKSHIIHKNPHSIVQNSDVR